MYRRFKEKVQEGQDVLVYGHPTYNGLEASAVVVMVNGIDVNRALSILSKQFKVLLACEQAKVAFKVITWASLLGYFLYHHGKVVKSALA